MIEKDYLGMELEMNKYYVHLDNSSNSKNGERPINDENQIKGKVFAVENINDKCVLLTLDTRTGFKVTDDRIVTVVEFVLFHEDFPIETLNLNFGLELQKFIEKFNIETYIEGGKITLYDFNPVEKTLYVKDLQSVHTFAVIPETRNKIKDLMIHVTCACPLKNIKIDDKTSRTFESPKNREEEFNFLLLVGNMIAGKGSGEDADPKQNMNVVNRTSFGAIFGRLEKDKKTFISGELRAQYGNETAYITKEVGPISNFIEKLTSVQTDSQYENDPTYKANVNENLGISKLGNSFGYNNQWPIFEFRDCGNVDLNKFSIYFDGVLKMLRNRETGEVSFRLSAMGL